MHLLSFVEVPLNSICTKSVARDQHRHRLVGIDGPSITIIIAMRQKMKVAACIQPHIGLQRTAQEFTA